MADRNHPGCLARTLRGFTWKRFALFCGIVALTATGHAAVTYLAPRATLAKAIEAFGWQFAYMFVFFGTVWVAVVTIGNWAPRRTGPRLATLFGAAIVGLVAGNLLNGLMPMMMPEQKDAPTLLKELSAIVLWSHVIAAGVLGYFFLTREEEAVARLHEEDLRREALDRELAEARLLVMQAQVEPHFLFNTLANVRRLFQTDASAARAMLAHLSRYLGAMLPRMRKSDSSLDHELTLALAYLSVQQIRMGPRLSVRSDVPEALLTQPFPPMMLVTLVENAIRHGLNPLPEGGEVRIQARATEGKLRVSVIDTGAGLSESSGPGVGLANIRARLSTLYGGRARLLLAQNPGRGVAATIEMPATPATPAVRAA
ncbi:MAG: histidine kinase [Burkholderiales bacterium]|nr:histidine kinase [Burkholderiales bacterium]